MGGHHQTDQGEYGHRLSERAGRAHEILHIAGESRASEYFARARTTVQRCLLPGGVTYRQNLGCRCSNKMRQRSHRFPNALVSCSAPVRSRLANLKLPLAQPR